MNSTEGLVSKADSVDEIRKSDAPDSPGAEALNLLQVSLQKDSLQERAVNSRKAGPMLCNETDDTKLLSMVGPILSYEFHSSGECSRAAHPFGQTSWHAVDLRRQNPDFAYGNDYQLGEPAKLTDFFRKEDLHAALIKDKVVQKALSSIGVKPSAVKSLDELIKAVGSGIPYVDDANQESSSKNSALCFNLNKDMLSNFAFDHIINGNKIAVRIGLSGTGVCRENLTQIGILLPIPSSFRQAAADASSRKAGFLMENRPGIKTSYNWQFEF